MDKYERRARTKIDHQPRGGSAKRKAARKMAQASRRRNRRPR